LQPLEIILVLDNDVGLVDFYRSRVARDVKIVVSDGFGLSNARNAGVKKAEGEIVAFIDDDAVADEKWLENLIRNYDDLSVVGVGGRIEPLWDEGNPGWFPEELYWIVGCSYKGLPTKKAVIRNPIGCNMSFRRRVIEEVGYFSTAVGRIGNNLLGHEDTEFGIRVTNRLQGKKILYDPEAVVYHRVPANRASLKYVIKRSYAEGFSKAFFPHKNSTSQSALNTEKKYLRDLLVSTSNRLFRGKGRQDTSQLLNLWVSTIVVFLGYIIGLGSD
jgi:cellulose synthase/poly-beta-1,6-N-acetylglucosamine synthase-like glycosyltransferase